MNIRLATMADLQQGLELFSSFVNETAYQIFELDAEKALLYITDLIARKRIAVAEVEHDNIGVLAGALALDVVTYPFTSDASLSQCFFYVRPEWRKTRAAVALRDSAVEYADKLGLPLFMDHLAGVGDYESKDEFFERAGFTKLGSSFLYRR